MELVNSRLSTPLRTTHGSTREMIPVVIYSTIAMMLVRLIFRVMERLLTPDSDHSNRPSTVLEVSTGGN